MFFAQAVCSGLRHGNSATENAGPRCHGQVQGAGLSVHVVQGPMPHLMAVALSSSRELCAGLQSTACTLPAPCTIRLRALQPPLVSVRQVSALLMSNTCGLWVQGPGFRAGASGGLLGCGKLRWAVEVWDAVLSQQNGM